VENSVEVSKLNIPLGSELGVAGLFPDICVRGGQSHVLRVESKVCTKVCWLC